MWVFSFLWFGAVLHEDPSYCCFLLLEGIDLNNPTKLRENQTTEHGQKPPRPNPFGKNRHFSSGLCFVVFSSCVSGHVHDLGRFGTAMVELSWGHSEGATSELDVQC